MAPRRDTASQGFLILLTIGIFGLQSTLAVQTSKTSPFLLSLGLPKTFLSLIWTAGPIVGAIAQPYLGLLSDHSSNSWGKRRPFIVCGAALMAPSLLSLAWVQEMSQELALLFHFDPSSIWRDALLRSLVVIDIWTYFFGFQMAQVGFRALIVDSCPPHLLDQAMVWATRWNCLGNLVCYGAGFLDLPSIVPWLGASDMKILASLAAVIIVLTTGVVCCVVQEENPEALIPRSLLPRRKMGFAAMFRQVFRNIGSLPPNIRVIFQVQFCAWAGWFLFNYFISTYVGALRNREAAEQAGGLSPQILIDEAAARYGSFGLLSAAVMTLATSVLAPSLITWAQRPSSFHPSLTLRNLWFAAQVIFAASMLSTFIPAKFLHTSTGTIFLVSLTGIPWAMTTWAPFSLIGEEINILKTRRRVLDDSDDEKIDETNSVQNSGTVMSLYITVISLPQLLATLTSGVIFWLADDSEVSLSGLDYVLKCSGAVGAVAAWRILSLVDRAR